MPRNLKPWVPVALWMLFIFIMSTDIASANHTSRVIEPLLRWVKPDITTTSVDLVHLLVRKCGHLSEYAVLAMLARRAVAITLEGRADGWSWRAAAWGWAIASCYSMTDEFHQAFVASRTSSLGDVAIDSCGALIGLAMLFAWSGASRVRDARV